MLCATAGVLAAMSSLETVLGGGGRHNVCGGEQWEMAGNRPRGDLMPNKVNNHFCTK